MAKRRLYWLLWCAAMGLLYLFENDTATRILLVCSVALPLMCVLVVPIAAKLTSANLNAPQNTAKHVDFPVVCEIKCPFPLVGFSVKLRCRNLLTGEDTNTTTTVQGTKISCSLHTDHCGLLMLEAMVTIYDIFGLFTPKPLPVQPVSVFAMPELPPLEVVLDESGGDLNHESASSLLSCTDASDPYSVREYVPGDPVRQIHWKLSQKTDTIMLRELRQPVANQVLLIFDASCPLAAGQVFPEAADDMGEMFLSLSKTLLGMGVLHTVCWHPSKQPMPVYHPMVSGEDWAELMSDFFSDEPIRDAPILPDDFTEYFAHVALVSIGSPDTGAVSGFGQRLTIIAEGDNLAHSQVML